MVQFNVPNCFSGDCDCKGKAPPNSFCPYGNCFDCIPSECDGPKCCCCASIDIVLGVRTRCFDRIYYSCNLDGTSSGPGEDSFPNQCPQCFEACDFALGGVEGCSSISDSVSPPDWWTFPPSIGPCSCDCEDFVDPADPSAGCNLTCVRCSGLRCNADVNVVASNCNYQFNLTPGTSCCGTPSIVDVIFVIDYSGSMGNAINNVIANVSALANGLIITGAQARFGLVVYGKSINDVTEIFFSNREILTTDIDDFTATMTAQLPLTGGIEPALDAVEHALVTYPWLGVENLLFLIGDEHIGGGLEDKYGNPISPALPIQGGLGDPSGQPSVEMLIDLCEKLGVTVHTVQPNIIIQNRYDSRKTDLALGTNGTNIDILTNFSDVIDDLNLNVFGASCGCLDLTPIPVQLCAGGSGVSGDECIDPSPDIPIRKCVEEDNSDCQCHVPFIFDVCGEIVIVTPDASTTNLVCCGDLEGGGCSCPSDLNPPAGCCGLCDNVDICADFQNVEDAINAIWCECWQKGIDGEFIIETPGCSRCIIPEPSDPDFGNLDIDAITNCTIKLPDGDGGFIVRTRSQIVTEVRAAWENCLGPDEPPPPPSISEASCLPDCDRQDECIVGDLDCDDTKDIRDCRRAICDNSAIGNTSTRNPDVAILNNGIGIVAYESMEKISVIKIDQFNTSIPAKILPNRRTNYGRLQHNVKWEKVEESGTSLVKLYYYDEEVPSNFINGITGLPAPEALTDTLVFQNGPLQNQCFSLHEVPIGVDEIGKFIQFTVADDVKLSNVFPSLDDVYDIEWFIIDSDDTGLTGSASESTNTGTFPGEDFMTNTSGVNQILKLTPHTHNGKSVPIANPSIAVAHNYMNSTENSHYVYLTYQALENNKWNIYLRQIRLSEYSREEQLDIGNATFISLSELNLEELNYRIICVNDKCDLFGDNFLAKRTISLEITLKDGRDVFNQGLLDSTESWKICPGSPEGESIKKKVFVELVHSVVVDRCPDQFEFNAIFYNWDVGDEFSVPFKELSAIDLFTLLRKPNDSAVGLGENIVKVSGITVTSSQVGAVWFDDILLSTWVTPDFTTFKELSKFKGLDLSNPIPLTNSEEGHCTHPIVSVNTNNEIYVIYECTDPIVHQIHIIGTSTPSSSLPLGIFVPKNLDASLDYFLSPKDFVYKANITLTTEGINQLPDIHIDENDVIHVAWQSNRDNYWEIYYANSMDLFSAKRITDSNSKSFKPSITGDERGNLHIAWHDNRFGNWEILMAYRDDERVQTIFEQDPYLAGVRNPGYTHVTDVIPLTLKNISFTDPLCISDLSVRFFEDRLLTIAAFDVTMADFPASFQIPGIQNDRTTIVWTYTEIQWILELTKVTLGSAPVDYDRWGPSIRSLDSTIIGSYFDTVQIEFTTQPQYIRFLASPFVDEIEELEFLKNKAILAGEDPDTLTVEDTDWIKDMTSNANWIKTTIDLDSGTIYNIQDLATNLFESQPFVLPTGRYKRVEILLTVDDSFDFDSIEVISVKKNRLCLAPQETVTAFLDLTPSIRLNKSGNEVVDIPLPVKARKNIVYFISAIGITDNGQIYVFGDPKQSVSCESCAEDSSSWNASACVFTFKFNNFDSPVATRFYNARIRFFSDQEKKNTIAQFYAFNDINGNLEGFTLDDNTKAQDVWQDGGFEVFHGQSRTVTLWPMLSNVTGILCGVKYWVETAICSGISTELCSRSNLDSPDLDDTTLTTWICDCSSPRWTEKFGDAPLNIRDLVKWRSSGDGFADTRLTETGNSNNLNPKIQIRSDLTGVVIYESNRDHVSDIGQDGEKYTLYATAFSIFPSSNMYASGSQSIIGGLGNLLIQSDISINECSSAGAAHPDGCDDCDDREASCNAMEGRNVSFKFDQYDNIFLSAERQNDQINCEEFQEDRQQSLIVHRCGVRAKNLIFATVEGGTIACNPSEILGKTAPLTTDKTFKQIIKIARVKNKFAKYHITRVQKPVAVVDQCSIEIEIATEPDTIAIRLKNESNIWSSWYPFDAKFGEYTMSIPWDLSLGSGVKTVTVEAATYQGISTSFTMTVIADYKGVDHSINFYKIKGGPIPGSSTTHDEMLGMVSPASSTFKSQAFDQDNLLPKLLGVPVAGIRNPVIEGGSSTIFKGTGEFIFIEIMPSGSYLEALETPSDFTPSFDVLQQGAEDSFAVPTVFDVSSGSFRGVFVVKKDNQTFFKDGLSFIIPHFKKDCSDITISAIAEGEYIRDRFNVVVSEGIKTPTDAIPTDVWASERDKLGQIQYPITVRGTEDPYFVFGDPNYRLKNE